MTVLVGFGGLVGIALLWTVLRATRCSSCGCGTRALSKSA